jgi:predicted dehydrogenase
MKSSGSLSVGVVGLGYWGSKYLSALSQMNQIDCRFVVDNVPSRISGARVPAGVLTYSSLESALDECEVQAVFIVTPATSHRELIEVALDHKKHVFVEKPMVLTEEDYRFLANKSVKMARTLFPGHIYAHNEAARVLGRRAASGEFGILRYITSRRIAYGPVRPDVGVVWDLLPHDLTILGMLGLGQPGAVSAIGREWIKPGRQDAVWAILDFPNGATAQLTASWVGPQKVRDMALVGDLGMAYFDDASLETPLWTYGIGLRDMTAATYPTLPSNPTGKADQSLHVPRAEPLREMIQAFISSCHDPALSLGELSRGLDIVVSLQAIQESIDLGGVLVKPRRGPTKGAP